MFENMFYTCHTCTKCSVFIKVYFKVILVIDFHIIGHSLGDGKWALFSTIDDGLFCSKQNGTSHCYQLGQSISV